MRKILLPTDFSENAENAIKYAIELFNDEECDFYILHVCSTMGFATDHIMAPEIGEIAYKSIKETSEKGLKETLGKFQKKNSSRHNFFSISKFNSLLNSIDEIVEKENIDLIIMGTQGATNSVDILFGSNTVMVMEKIRGCPVLAIPSETEFVKPKEIVFPTSYNTHYKRRELKHLVEIARNNKAAIRILHIEKKRNHLLAPTQKINKELLEEYFEDLDFSFHVLFNIDVRAALDCFVQSRDSNMIAFINKKHGFIESVFTRHLAQELGYKSKVPVLAMHNL